MHIPSSASARQAPGRRFLFLGILLAALGPLGYGVQIATQRLTAPWYLPVLATLGVTSLAVALWQKRNIWRVLALVVVLLLATAEWAFLLATRLPAYTGPVEVGRAFPVFASLRADGTPFTQNDLVGPQNNLLVFFRGRW